MANEKDLLTDEQATNAKEDKSTKEYLFQEVAELVRKNFVATYEKEDCVLRMRLPSGKTFQIIVQDM